MDADYSRLLERVSQLSEHQPSPAKRHLLAVEAECEELGVPIEVVLWGGTTAELEAKVNHALALTDAEFRYIASRAMVRFCANDDDRQTSPMREGLKRLYVDEGLCDGTRSAEEAVRQLDRLISKAAALEHIAPQAARL